ncbi:MULTISPECIES: alpha-galactosidase [unclassified Cryobacterium]|uniref:alpha-galactosidase n=1 Tax=unclassified Cryobacterium TaxID=2649013 RepID=UPI002AB3D15E|nr:MULTISPECIES: alpha-galactosidase [unclassified Cryobacterium]MDY7541325.1 alpha-galactosidase [Cryobacterium sp. 5B3]MEA9998125.1 alpha-galactosidase [Cryobacterium sp. RTS3]MEB0265315.1 alpha-galactosidase [Cryobacterium sp. 10I5]MEB0273376.1 alpha-galactosidase [Cryobacterium sp. 5B3]
MTLHNALLQKDTVHELAADGVSFQVDVSSGTPVISYWGQDLGSGSRPGDLTVLMDDGVPQANVDDPEAPGMWRENARGFLGRPALLGHRDGQDWSQMFTIINTEATSSSLVIDSADEAAGLLVSVAFRMQPDGVLLITQTVTNTGTDTFDLNELTTWLPLPDHAVETMDFTGRWLKERQPQRRPIQTGTWSREVREGRSSHDYTVVQLALTAGADFQNGSVWSAGLLWSGNTRHLVERLASGSTSIGAGELLLPGESILPPGATYSAPTVAATFSATGIDGMTDRLYRWLRARPEHPSTARPLTLNVWEAVYFDHDLAKLSELVEVAAEIGVERFVLDDGWFLGRRNDFAGLGDWTVDPAVWPNGLGPLVDRVTGASMQFGLWFEGEMVNADSDLYREHPEWIFQAGGRIPPEARHQQVLDLGHPGAYEHVLGQVDAILSEYDIGYIKWDHNRVLTEAAHLGGAGVRRQTEAVYRLFDELKRRHPGLEIESCSSGGGRVDLGMAGHADRFWTSDCNDALERQYIQRYTQFAIPPELLGSHIGPTRSHTTGRVHSLAFRAITALFGHAGIEWDVTETTDSERQALVSWADYYKRKRALIHSGRMVRVLQPQEDSFVHGVVAQDGSEGIFAYVQLAAAGSSNPPRFLVPGLDPDARYRVRVAEPAGEAGTIHARAPQWMAGIETSGLALALVGLRPPILLPESAILIEFERI